MVTGSLNSARTKSEHEVCCGRGVLDAADGDGRSEAAGGGKHMRSIAAISLALVITTLGACNFNVSTTLGNAELNGEAQDMYRELVTGEDEALIGRLSSANDPQAVRLQLDMLRDLVGTSAVPEPVVTGSRSSTTNAGRFYEVAQDYTYPDRVVTVSTTFIAEDGDWKVQGFHLNTNLTRVPANRDSAGEDGPLEVAQG
jgi:hypothetical protein